MQVICGLVNHAPGLRCASSMLESCYEFTGEDCAQELRAPTHAAPAATFSVSALGVYGAAPGETEARGAVSGFSRAASELSARLGAVTRRCSSSALGRWAETTFMDR